MKLNILFILNKNKANAKGFYVLMCRMTYNKIRNSFSTGLFINPKYWNSKKQKGICVVCKNPFDISEMEANHITPWHEGGKTIEENCQMLFKEDNRRKSGK